MKHFNTRISEDSLSLGWGEGAKPSKGLNLDQKGGHAGSNLDHHC